MVCFFLFLGHFGATSAAHLDHSLSQVILNNQKITIQLFIHSRIQRQIFFYNWNNMVENKTGKQFCTEIAGSLRIHNSQHLEVIIFEGKMSNSHRGGSNLGLDSLDWVSALLKSMRWFACCPKSTFLCRLFALTSIAITLWHRMRCRWISARALGLEDITWISMANTGVLCRFLASQFMNTQARKRMCFPGIVSVLQGKILSTGRQFIW